jgi:GNAT superfamily N-acetyltransferase
MSEKREEGVEIVDLTEDNIDDLIHICSAPLMEDPVHREGVELKKKWLKKMLKEYGPCAKIAYLEGRPVAQILFYPEVADPSKPGRRGVLYIHCIYNSVPEAQRKGVGSRLLKSVIEEAAQGAPCLQGEACKFITTIAFNTHEYLPQPDFFKRKGFREVPGGLPDELYLEVKDRFEDVEGRVREYRPLPEDRDKAIILYGPECQFAYYFAVKIKEIIHSFAPDLPVELIDVWERPEEAERFGNQILIVRGRPINAFVTDREAFLKEVREALVQE